MSVHIPHLSVKPREAGVCGARMCSTISSSLFRVDVLVPQCQWKPNFKNLRYWKLQHSERKFTFFIQHSPISSSFDHDDSSISPPPPPPPPKPASKQKQSQLSYDPSEELFGISTDPQTRKIISDSSNPRSWFGPNGQYIRELPCPNCRGRGYTPCTECGIERSRADCSLCKGKGITVCAQCLGECVIWEESIDEQPWEKARSVSPVKVKEDDEVDNLDIKLDVKRKTKRIYQSPPPEVNLKISRSLKILNAKTGIFSKRMKIIHQNPFLHAQRVAAIKKSKGTLAARRHASETMKSYFSNPHNRHKRSLAMKGIKFFCSNCGREGHRRNYCPEILDEQDHRFRCRLCGEKGHNRRTCWKAKSDGQKPPVSRNHHCRICGQSQHNSRTCPQRKIADGSSVDISKVSSIIEKRIYTCSLCKEKGHNKRTCLLRNR